MVEHIAMTIRALEGSIIVGSLSNSAGVKDIGTFRIEHAESAGLSETG
jgi:hypothetical protein